MTDFQEKKFNGRLQFGEIESGEQKRGGKFSFFRFAERKKCLQGFFAVPDVS